MNTILDLDRFSSYLETKSFFVADDTSIAKNTLQASFWGSTFDFWSDQFTAVKQIISVHKGSGRNSRGGEQWIITYLSQWPNGKGKEKQKKIEKITRSLTQEGCSNRPSNRKVHN